MPTFEVTGRRISYDGVSRDLSHLAESVFEEVVTTARAYAEAGMRPPALSVIVEGVDVTGDPRRWPVTECRYTGKGRLEVT